MSKHKEFETGTLSIRFDRKIRFKLELAARIKRMNLSAFINDCCAEIMSNMDTKIDLSAKESNIKLDKLFEKTWNIDFDKRLLNIRNIAPNILTYDEDVYLNKMLKGKKGVKND